MYPDTYYKVLMPKYRETGQIEVKTDPVTGRSYELRWQEVCWLEVGRAESIADAKEKFPWLRNPVLEPVGFRAREFGEDLIIHTQAALEAA